MYCLIIRNIQDITFDLLKDTDNVKIIMQRGNTSACLFALLFFEKHDENCSIWLILSVPTLVNV